MGIITVPHPTDVVLEEMGTEFGRSIEHSQNAVADRLLIQGLFERQSTKMASAAANSESKEQNAE